MRACPKERKDRILEIEYRHKRGGKREAIRGEVKLLILARVPPHRKDGAGHRIDGEGKEGKENKARIAGISLTPHRIQHYGGTGEVEKEKQNADAEQKLIQSKPLLSGGKEEVKTDCNQHKVIEADRRRPYAVIHKGRGNITRYI